MAPTLFIHCGHSKTGSSALQETLVNNTEALAAEGAIYPVPEGAYCRRFNVGNGYALTRGASLAECVAPALNSGSVAGGAGCREAALWVRPEFRKVLVSSEFLTPYLGRSGHLERLLSEAKVLGFGSVRFLIFTRDPLEFAVSLWLEWVKTQGESRTIDEVLLTPDDGKSDMFSAVRTAEALTAMRAAGVDVTVRNFGRVGRRTLPVFFAWAGLTPLPASPAPVNRSLSAEEVAIMLKHNQILGADAHWLGRALVDRLPDQAVRRIHPSVEAARQFLAMNSDACAYVNREVDVAGRYDAESLDWHVGPEPSELPVSQAQAAIIVETLSEMAAHRTDLSSWGLRDYLHGFVGALRSRFHRRGQLK